MAIPLGNVNETSPAESAPQTAISVNIAAASADFSSENGVAPEGFSSGIGAVTEGFGGSEVGSGRDSAALAQAVSSVEAAMNSTAENIGALCTFSGIISPNILTISVEELSTEFIEAASMAEKERHQRLGGKGPQPAVGTLAFSVTA